MWEDWTKETRDLRLIRQTFFFEKPDIVCLQERKLDEINDVMKKEICGRRLGEAVILKAQHTRGGILIAWRHIYRIYRYITHIEYIYCLSVRLIDTFTGAWLDSGESMGIYLIKQKQVDFVCTLKKSSKTYNAGDVACGSYRQYGPWGLQLRNCLGSRIHIHKTLFYIGFSCFLPERDKIKLNFGVYKLS